MDAKRIAGAVLLGLVLAAQAQAGTGDVQESTDPAKAAEVEKKAAVLRSRPPQPVVEPVRARTADGYELLSGGVTLEDRIAMHAERGRYSLWVATVAKPSGAYLVDASLRIIHLETKRLILERKMEGPWLFVALPEGRYEVSAAIRDADAEQNQTLATRVNIQKTGQRQAVLRFDSRADVGPGMPNPFNGNPFGTPSPSR